MAEDRSVPDVVVVGAAARDIAPGDPRGWRLGGGVTFGALAMARLGIRTGVVIGLDALAADGHRLDGLPQVEVVLGRHCLAETVLVGQQPLRTDVDLDDPRVRTGVPGERPRGLDGEGPREGVGQVDDARPCGVLRPVGHPDGVPRLEPILQDAVQVVLTRPVVEYHLRHLLRLVADL